MRISWRSRKPRTPATDAEPPLGVILHVRDLAIPCIVTRAPGLDRHGRAAWIAVPVEPVTITEGDDVWPTATVMPDDADVLVRIPEPERADVW